MIVILAIIALIATPIVLNIIEDSKDSSNKRSIDGYAKAVEYAVATYQIENATGNIGGIFTTEDGTKITGDATLTVDYDGDVVCDTIEVYSDGSIYLADCKVNGVLVDYTYGTKQEIPICKLLEGQANTIGSKYQCKVKDEMEEEYKEGYILYVLSYNYDENDNTKIVSTNLIMERNICNDGTMATAENTCYTSYSSATSASGIGPNKAMKYLNEATSEWREELTLNETYNDESGHFTGFVLNGKARMPKLSEVSRYDKTNKTNAYLYDYLQPEDNIQETPVSGIHGYWTLSCYSLDGYMAMAVTYFGSLTERNVDGNTGVIGGSGYGVRPVITLKI